MKPKFKFRWRGYPVPSDRSKKIFKTIMESDPGGQSQMIALAEARDPGDPFLQTMLWSLMATSNGLSPSSRALVKAIAVQVLDQCKPILEGKCWGVQTYGDDYRIEIRPAQEPPDMDHWFDPL